MHMYVIRIIIYYCLGWACIGARRIYKTGRHSQRLFSLPASVDVNESFVSYFASFFLVSVCAKELTTASCRSSQAIIFRIQGRTCTLTSCHPV